ncbi:hypothetical protein StoSoilA2_03510 [Arthrobacter sp. StoSoilA2]|uniref:hypothetical protein n=1 Tax=Arthrobacter sp. StoSoilA2 TaxID=2830990 RepID=UPI001CC5722B|nr:hypothetical protein [Arthrobacter sp. StoSoilA2]BCW34295.1 hypothetical protein StoSoilA2_03510 [Arthrobacter sp. StoSoilA2]
MGATPVQDKWAWVAGPVAVALGLAAHVVSGGGAPAMPVLLGFVALSALAAQLVARWIHGPILLLLLSGVAQQLLFFGFEALGGSFSGVGFLDHLHGQPQQPVAVPVDGQPASGELHAGDLMLYTHAAAAILTLVVAAGVSRLARPRATFRSFSVAGPPRDGS